MKELVRCKACGYIMEKSALGEVCPACGVKAQMFEPFEDKVGAMRRLLLDLDIHPVVVHAPETLAFLLILLPLVFPLVPSDWQNRVLWPSIQLLSWIFPFAVLAGFLSGLWDGKVRYRKVTTPILTRKIVLGLVLLAASVAMPILASSTAGFSDFAVWIGYVVVAVVAMGCAGVLGLIGAKLTHGAMPGDKIFLGKKKKPAAKSQAPKAENTDKS